MTCLHKVLNKYFLIDVWQNSEYAAVLNILGLHKVVSKIFHHRYLAGVWIFLEFWIYQCYTGFCRKQPVIQVWQVNEYTLGSLQAVTWIYKGCEYPKVLWKLYFKDSYYFECLEFWMCWCFEYLRSLKTLYLRVLNINTSSYFFDRILNTLWFRNMPGFWIY